MRRALGVIALVLTGCYEDTCPVAATQSSVELEDWRMDSHARSTLTVDTQLSPVVRDAVTRAVNLWGSESGGDVQITLVPGDPTESFSVKLTDSKSLKPGMLAMSKGSVIYIGPDLQGSGYLNGGLVHEFGHYLGLGHEPELPDDIMYPCTHSGMPDAPTPDAVRDLRELYESP